MRKRNNKFWMVLVVLMILVLISQTYNVINLNNELRECQKENQQYEQQIEDYEKAIQKDMDDAYLCKLASYYGGDAAQRAYNMQVVLNIADENASIQEVILKQLYEVEGLTAYEFEEINYIKTENFDALALIYQYNIDTTRNSTEFIKWQ